MKNHYNGAAQPKAHLRMEITEEQVLKAPMIASPFGLFDCCPTTDGAAAAIVCRADLAKRFRSRPILVKGVGLAVETGRPYFDPTFDYLGFRSTQKAAPQAYKMAGITAERHRLRRGARLLHLDRDLEHRGPRLLRARARAARWCEEGRTALDGDIPINPSGGLKSFGHPIGASGVRMIYEVRHAAPRRGGERQVKDAAARPGPQRRRPGRRVLRRRARAVTPRLAAAPDLR